VQIVAGSRNVVSEIKRRARRPEMSPGVAIATCAMFPRLPDDEALLLEALRARGVAAAPAVWDSPEVEWDGYELVVIRATWDYVWHRDAFVAWTQSLPRVLNAPEVVSWNTDKRYLAELPGIVATRFVAPGEAWEPPDGEFVVKPSVSAGAQDSARYGASGSDAWRAREHVARLGAAGRTALVQPYLPSVDERGETGLIYIGGRYSHAIRKGPLLRSGETPGRRLFAQEQIDPRIADDSERAVAERALDALPFPRAELLYARVDLIGDAAGEPQLIELELTEPSLYLSLGEGAVERLAQEVVGRL
jgi:hypothetical protein